MYNNVFRSYCMVTRQFCCKLTQCKFINTRLKVFDREHVQHRVLIVRSSSSNTRSHEITTKFNTECEEKLNELLKCPANEMLYKKIEYELEMIKYESGKFPKEVTAENWIMLLSGNSKAQRRSYLYYLWKNEIKAENQKKKKELRAATPLSEPETDHIKYGLKYNSLLLRISDTTMTQYYNKGLINAILYEPKIVFDLGYDDIMTRYETQNCAKQLVLTFAANRAHINPFNLYFCNANMSGYLMEKLHQSIPTIYDLDFPLHITSKSYLDLFDKSELVYLTPHANTYMEAFDPDKVYIIGGLVDKIHPKPSTLVKAKREGIQMLKFPLEKYLDWGSGSAKNLAINQVMNILLDLRHTNNWGTALKHVPTRKLKQERMKTLMNTTLKRKEVIQKLMNQS
ncbi:mitochondrial ribonuclease P protein 1 homolog [Colletes gigas]|uniref:mitochondrial ribonuclease P protein 1 homolog n=1 Tax=Colletes gigas TaxID=935657 RepID=UPI001C9A76EC|nr:mitochondrial ribonuclease P protein 1 homolog [Colletes gigas]